MTNFNQTNIHQDSLIVETLLTDELLYKKADLGGVTSELIQKVKEYVEEHLKSESLINLLAPGAVTVMLGAMGMGWMRFLIGMAMKIFNIDVSGILSSIHNKIKPAISSGKPIDSSHIDNIVDSSVKEHTPTLTEADLDRLKTQADSKDDRFLKLAMISYAHDQNIKTAGLLNIFSSRQSKTSRILAKILGLVFKTALASAGLMVAGDVFHRYMGQSTPLDKVIGPPSSEDHATTTQIAAKVSTQTKFKVNSSYKDQKYNIGENNWVLRVNNDKPSMENMLVAFAKEVYDGLDGKDNIIRSSSDFNSLVDDIYWFNHNTSGDPIIFIPRNFTSKKQLVDVFIDEVADKIPNVTPPPSAYKNIM